MILVNTEQNTKELAYKWIQPKAHIMRNMQENDRHIAFIDSIIIKY